MTDFKNGMPECELEKCFLNLSSATCCILQWSLVKSSFGGMVEARNIAQTTERWISFKLFLYYSIKNHFKVHFLTPEKNFLKERKQRDREREKEEGK